MQALVVPDVNVQFFVANALCSKVRSSWLSLDAATQSSLYERMLAVVQSVLTGALALQAAVQNRLCGAVSTAAALGGSDMCASFLKQTLSLGLTAPAGQPLSLAVELLQAFAQETLQRPNAHVSIVKPLISGELPAILAVLDRSLALNPAAPGPVFLCAKVCMRMLVMS